MNNNKSNLSVVSKNYNRKEPRLRENLCLITKIKIL